MIVYGSLMSGLGMARSGTLPASAVARVRLRGCRRGYGKFSMYGDRFAMVLEALRAAEPIRAEPLADGDPEEGAPEALALTLALPELITISVREGYRAEACLALAEQARAAGRTLPAHLWATLEAAGRDQVAYRRALAAALGYASPHYIPHPVATAGEPAIVFLPPGEEGSGRDDVVPVRVQSAMTRVLTVREVWRMKPNVEQLDYIAMALLAEVHGLALVDLYGDLGNDRPLFNRVRARLAEDAAAEPERFRAALGLSAEAYAAALPPRAWHSPLLQT